MRRFWLAIAVAMVLAVGCNAAQEHAQGGAAQGLQPSAPPTAVFASKPSASDLLLQAIGNHRLVLLGEMHGTQETPALAASLVSHYAAAHEPVVLGLEIDRNEQGDVDRFLASSGNAQARASLLEGLQWSAPFDGRDSHAVFELIDHARRLRASGADVRIVFFDASDRDMNVRNKRMADTLRAAAGSSDAMLLVLTGNVHAMTRTPAWEMYSDGVRIEPPMTAGRYLADLHPVSIDIGAASGEYWACMRRQCGPVPVRPQEPLAAPKLEQQVPTESAWDFTLTLPRFHVSRAAIEPAGSLQSDGHRATVQ